MPSKLRDLDKSHLERLPALTPDHGRLGEEMIYLHLWNRKKMNWYLAEFSPISLKFYGYFENPKDTITSGTFDLDEILRFGKKGVDWEPTVDEDWIPKPAQEIDKLKGYIEFIKTSPDDFT